MRDRDSQRQRVYDAEAPLIFEGERYASLDAAQRELDRLLAMTTLRKRFPDTWTAPRTVTVVGGGSSRATYHAAGWGRGGARIMFAPHNRTEYVLLHELAHHLTRDAEQAHGWEFAAALLWLVRFRLGRETHDRLRAAMRKTGARYTAPRARRQLSDEQRAAASARLAAARERRDAERADERGEWLIEIEYELGRFFSSQDSLDLNGRYRWAEVSGSGAWRGVRQWHTSPSHRRVSVYTLRSTAERWAATESDREAIVRVVSLAEAQQHDASNVETRHAARERWAAERAASVS